MDIQNPRVLKGLCVCFFLFYYQWGNVMSVSIIHCQHLHTISVQLTSSQVNVPSVHACLCVSERNNYEVSVLLRLCSPVCTYVYLCVCIYLIAQLYRYAGVYVRACVRLRPSTTSRPRKQTHKHSHAHYIYKQAHTLMSHLCLCAEA